MDTENPSLGSPPLFLIKGDEQQPVVFPPARVVVAFRDGTEISASGVMEIEDTGDWLVLLQDNGDFIQVAIEDNIKFVEVVYGTQPDGQARG
jgi:hypothetical protein